MRVIGIDLTGPTNTADTALVCLEATGGQLTFVNAQEDLDDPTIGRLVREHGASDTIIIGIDAPLSYQVGGGDRVADRELRRLAVAHGMRPGSVMPPTMTRMAYLTLRGISLARALELQAGDRPPAIVEVHPGAALVLRRAPLDAVRAVKRDPQARLALLAWLRHHRIPDLPAFASPSDHMIMACASAIAAADWALGRSWWIWKAEPPQHPYDIAC
ncbi:DUF429 domain-containing protein [Oscillochloris sp. ZM17-4]|uniref:DUF429 domain-containing protein n=1 Tax=Oscillochloris sp. ZM17-4 TaxID=2866714 RepID=UPI001C73D48E|nr:DUF429 domain-containing protein [Oscillochloris sp. ZM17-4]MBX0330840.1 DUF429 domain-containing protein [Oscillochloris sp. ZM17-4]